MRYFTKIEVIMGTSRRAGEVGLHYLTTSAQVRRAVDEYLARSGLSLSRTKILQVLARRGPVNQAQLAVELGLAARSITQAVEGMERDGLVRRSPDADDRRAKVVTATAEGTRALAAGESAGDEILRRIFHRLGRDRLADLAETLALIDVTTAQATRLK
jgi:DNA-binding MarR family transcriptional regulator